MTRKLTAKSLRKLLEGVPDSGQITFYINPPKAVEKFMGSTFIYADKVQKSYVDTDVVDGSVYVLIDLEATIDHA